MEPIKEMSNERLVKKIIENSIRAGMRREGIITPEGNLKFFPGFISDNVKELEQFKNELLKRLNNAE